MTTSEGTSPGARLIDRWMQREKEKNFVVVPDKRYARHAKFFNKVLLPECGDEMLAMQLIDMFFEEKLEYTNGWSVGNFQVKYRLFLAREWQRKVWVDRAQRREEDAKIEREERQGAVPPPETEAAATVRWLAKAKEANLKEKA